MVIVPDEQANADEGEQEFKGYDEYVDHNGMVLRVTCSVIWRTPNCRGSIQTYQHKAGHLRCALRFV